MASVVWLLPALPLAAFALLVLFRRYLPGGGALVSILAILGAFVAYWPILLDYLANGETHTSTIWMRPGSLDITIGLQVDALSMLMAGLITFVSLMVQVYSLGYMRGEERLGLYFAYQSLFAASMLLLVLADSFLLLYGGWELVGLCSFLLIGFHWERRSAAEAAKKAFITTRFGDVGLFIALGILFIHAGTFDMAATFGSLGSMDSGLLTVTGLLMFAGAMGKSAQVPFHVWLPDAMEGPTPVSALIHAATMVTAGVFLVARAFPVLDAAGVLPVVAAIGMATAFLAGALALATRDIKRVLAYSTVSQLGFMMVALGLRSIEAGMFHLLTHGFFKALLFLGAGAVLHSIHQPNATVDEVSGIRRRMPLTAAVFGIGALAIAGVPPLSGFFSKEEIVGVALHEGNAVYAVLLLGASFLTALYMTRLYVLLFTGAARGRADHTHDPEPVMAVPLLALAALALVAGVGLAPVIGEFLHGEGGFSLDPVLAIVSTLVAVGGIYIGWKAYYGRRHAPIWLTALGISRLSPLAVRHAPIWLAALGMGRLPQWATDGFGFDRVYQWAIDKLVLAGSTLLYFRFDRDVVNDIGVNGTAGLSVVFGRGLRLLQTGKLYNYALVMVIGAVAMVGVLYALG